MAGHRINEQTYYEILEVQPGALQNEIHAAYQRAKLTYSPDSPALYTMFTSEEARELLQLIEEAYQTLSNQPKRQAYDQKLRLHSGFHKAPSKEVELPDFDTEDIKNVAKARGEDKHIKIAPSVPKNTPTHETKVTEAPKSVSVPDGFKKTRYGIYEVNEAFENEIKSCTSFDGAMLAKIRQYKKINLEQMSQETRISKSYLSAVESQAFDALPAAVFVRGFIVQMSRLLGIDEKAAADSYMKIYKQHRLE
jgi:curved DNA-binding protein CbpA